MPKMYVCFSKIARKPQRNLFQRSFSDDIREIVNPDLEIERYGRTWRFSKYIEQDGYLTGKLGFRAAGTETVTDYDEEAKDYVEHLIDSRLSGYVLCALDPSKQVLAFEIKPPIIEYQSFKGAFALFLNSYPDAGLVFEDYVETAKFLAWVENDIDRMTSFKATLRIPNPDFSKETDYLYDTLERTNADESANLCLATSNFSFLDLRSRGYSIFILLSCSKDSGVHPHSLTLPPGDTGKPGLTEIDDFSLSPIGCALPCRIENA